MELGLQVYKFPHSQISDWLIAYEVNQSRILIKIPKIWNFWKNFLNSKDLKSQKYLVNTKTTGNLTLL